MRLVETIIKCLGIKYRDLCFQERIYCYLLAFTTNVVPLLLIAPIVGRLPIVD